MLSQINCCILNFRDKMIYFKLKVTTKFKYFNISFRQRGRRRWSAKGEKQYCVNVERRFDVS